MSRPQSCHSRAQSNAPLALKEHIGEGSRSERDDLLKFLRTTPNAVYRLRPSARVPTTVIAALAQAKSEEDADDELCTIGFYLLRVDTAAPSATGGIDMEETVGNRSARQKRLSPFTSGRCASVPHRVPASVGSL